MSEERADGSDPDGDIDDVFDELEALEDLVDSEAEQQQVRETMQALRRSRNRPFVRLRSGFDGRDVGEAVVGSFVFGMPMVVEEGTLEIGSHIAASPLLYVPTVALGFATVYGILHAAEFEKIEEDLIADTVPLRIVSIPIIAIVMALLLMTMWGRVDWSTPTVALGQVTITAIVMAVGASIGDILPES
ncbi:DUF2391 family protein [Halorubellus sp. JP-L1]|uniref:DUF2391 family protein n=1 Tax=Halorubellus sp. JP-L1 TaxID=2715753 RepID=UPI00140B3334|nr:DUF2391 family protein [Halorubellus sp. JP-L1]NHN43275.1 DUF2391 family protein [Halorubellus sp. JP-L1]